MHKLTLICGLLALLLASILTTVYIVNHARRAQADKISPAAAMEEITEVIKPDDLLAPPTPRTTRSVTPRELEEAIPVMRRPANYMLTYPDWETGAARIAEAVAVTNDNNYIKPRWSPVGIDLAFTTEDNSGIYLSDSKAGAYIRPITRDKSVGETFFWTPDGMSLKARGEDRTWAEFLITGERFPIPEVETEVYMENDRIFYRDDDGSVRQISGLEDRFTDPVLSPDGLKVVYRGRETGLYIGLTEGSRAIYVGEGNNATWLADSSAIVYDVPVMDGSSVVDGDLWTATVDGRTKSNLTNTPGIIESYPCVAPDGERIAFSAGGRIYVGKLSRQ